jgi:pseudomonalisin
MGLKRKTVGTALAVGLLCGALRILGGPQAPAPQKRITEPIDNGRAIRLPRTTHPRIRRAQDNGRVAQDLQMDRAVLTLKSSPEQQADLERLLADQQDPSSPQYHQWLTPQQFGERFGPSTEDVSVITNWLQSHGLTVNNISDGRREIEFSGTASQVGQAFQTEIHRYDFNGEMHVANATDIAIPQAFSPVVQGVFSLHDFGSRKKILRRRPDLNFSSGNHGLVPYDFATIYDVAALWNQGLDGTGQSIAIVGRSNLNPADVSAFRSLYGLPAKDPQVIVNGTDPGIVSEDEEGEADLDVEWSGAVAKGATIKFVVSKSTRTTDGAALSEMYIVNNNVAPVMSTSFGFCETDSPSTSLFYANLWSQAASQGMSIFVAAGDSGSAGCDDPSATSATGGLSVDGESSTPYDVAVGGSQFNENGATSTYWNTTNNTQNRSSAKSYIPEVAWNESGPGGLWAGGGGVSTIHSTPSWQTGNGVPTVDPGTTGQHHRYVPDISLTAAGHDGYVIQQRSSLFLVSGTSASSPAFAGIMAIINQATNRSNGNPNPRLYALAAQVPAAFHDVTSGTTAVPCTAGSPNCLNGVMTGYNAGPGFDLATGWGSVDAYVLVHSWSPQVQQISMISQPTLNSGSAGSAYTQTLSASGGTPPYRWTISSGTLPPGLTLTSTGSVTGTPTTAGSYSFTVQVSDSSGATTSQNDQITVNTASAYHVFPAFADGKLADGTYYRTTLMISNPGSITSTCTLQLYGLTLPGFGLTYPLGPNGWAIGSTSGTQALQSGYATLQCTAGAPVEAQLLYSFYAPNGTKLSETIVFSSPAGANASVVADQREGAQLALAIANDSDQTVTYTVSVTGANSTGSVTLGPRKSLAKFLSDVVAGIPANNLGVVQVSSGSGGTASVIGFRYTGTVFTTIPASTLGAQVSTANVYHVFPQFADGKFPDGSFYRTTRIYLADSGATSCTTQLRGVTTDGIGQFPVNLTASGTFIVAPTSGTQTFQSGYATTQCPSTAVEAQELYSFYASNGAKLSEGTVFSSPPAKTVTILADMREGAQVGLGIANDSDQSTVYSIVVSDGTGAVAGSASVTLQPRTAVAKFLTDFVSLPAGFVGQVTVSSDSGKASIMGARFTGNVFTTIPQTIRN